MLFKDMSKVPGPFGRGSRAAPSQPPEAPKNRAAHKGKAVITEDTIESLKKRT